jgi:hypothetical protein
MRRPGRDRAVDQPGRRRARRSSVADGDHAASVRRPGTILTRPQRVPDDGVPGAVRSGIWYRAVLSGDVIAAGGLTALCEQFAVTVREAGEPAGACLFAITEEMAGDRREAADDVASTAVFFSPTAISLVPAMLARCDAHPSAPPARARAALLVGRPSDWDLLPRTTH